jgi:RimJ/RimL family protein N-acetyltransferase
VEEKMTGAISKITKHVSLRLVETSDAEFILSLRLDAEKNKHLSKVSNDLQAQIDWITGYKQRELAKKEYYFIIMGAQADELGAVRLYDFRDDSFCWGSWILVRNAPIHAAIESALAVYEIAFFELGFNRSHFDVRKENTRVVDFHRRFGATTTGEDDLNWYFELTRDSYELTKKRYQRYFVD